MGPPKWPQDFVCYGPLKERILEVIGYPALEWGAGSVAAEGPARPRTIPGYSTNLLGELRMRYRLMEVMAALLMGIAEIF